MAVLNHKVNTEQPEESFEVMPAGDYPAVIEESEMVDTDGKNGPGRMLKLQYQIIDGNYNGRKLWENVCIQNPNPRTVVMAEKTLNSIAMAVGVHDTIVDSTILHNKPMIIEVCVKGKETDEYGIKNEIKKHLPINPGKTVANAPTVTAPVENTPAPATPPWQK